MAERDDLQRLLDALPIYAVRIGYEKDRSTDEDRAFADKVFRLHERWLELRAESETP